MAHDLLIRGGTVVDGTGAEARTADVAIADGRIVDVGDDVGGSAARTIDADGLVVTPGFVDVHTHLDAQLAWDPAGTSSCWHGVTSVVLGNCGVTFAPVRREERGFLAEMMESVEDIPASSILDGMPWDWHTYGDYLDTLGRLPLGLNVGGFVGHCALRWYAMGERSLDPEATPGDDELATMIDLVDEAIGAGALGFSTSRTLRHTVPDGRYVPGTFADSDELVALAQVLGRHGRGVVEVSPRFDGEGDVHEKVAAELDWMERASLASGRPVTFNLSQTTQQGDHWRDAIARAEAANQRGARIRPQTTARGIGVIFGLWNMTPFDGHPAWQELKQRRTLPERLAVLRDPQARARLVAEAERGPGLETLARFFVLTPAGGADYEPDPARSLVAAGERRGVSPAQAFVDLCLETEGRVIINWPLLNHDFAAIGEMLANPTVLLGLADSGAHVGQIMDASQPTWLLAHWVRKRGHLTLEAAVRRMTSDTATFAGIPDRGVLAPGAAADVNLIDLDGLRLHLPEYVHDFPGGAGRYVQRADGYVATVVNGEITLEGGEATGAAPGTVLRAAADG